LRALLASALSALALSTCTQAQQVHKLVTLTTSAEVRRVSVCGGSGLVAALSADGSVGIWRMPSGEAVAKRPPEDATRSVTCSADGKWIAAGKADGSVAITEISGAPVRTLAGSRQRTDGLAFSPDGSLLAIRSHDSPAQIWNTVRGVMVATLQTNFAGSGDMAFSPDGSLLATADLDTTVRIYDHAGKLRAIYTGLLLEPFAISFMPDGKQLVVGGADCTLTVLDASDGHLVRALPKQSDPVSFAAVLPDGARLLSLHFDAGAMEKVTTLLWDLRSGTSRELPIDGARFKGFGVTADRLPVLFTADSKTRLTAWALRD
jgi:WD40 repeat protein